jgi:hypothetical protein
LEWTNDLRALATPHNCAHAKHCIDLKSEIARVTRKEVRSEAPALKKAVVAYRAEIAALERRAQALE